MGGLTRPRRRRCKSKGRPGTRREGGRGTSYYGKPRLGSIPGAPCSPPTSRGTAPGLRGEWRGGEDSLHNFFIKKRRKINKSEEQKGRYFMLLAFRIKKVKPKNYDESPRRGNTEKFIFLLFLYYYFLIKRKRGHTLSSRRRGGSAMFYNNTFSTTREEKERNSKDTSLYKKGGRGIVS